MPDNAFFIVTDYYLIYIYVLGSILFQKQKGNPKGLKFLVCIGFVLF
jgi:hypothetical protein